MFGQIDHTAEIATCAYFFGFQRTDKVNRNYFSPVENRRIFSTRNNYNLPVLNERKMRHESRKEVSKQPTNGFITVIRDAPWPSEDIKRCLNVFGM